MRLMLCLFFIIALSFSAYASDINILTYRDNYRPRETFQAEIILDKEPLSNLNTLNLEFLNDDKAIGTLMYAEKLSNKRYFAYFDIPNVDPGDYKFRVKNVNIIDNGILRRISEEKTIKINDANHGFDYLINNQNNDGSFNDVTETALGALALKNIENAKANLAISNLINNQDPTGCYPKNNCNIKDTSFALSALSRFNQNYIKTKNWIKDASNNFNTGTWNLRISGDADCNGIQIDGTYDLSVNNKAINVTCNNQADFALTHNYLGNTFPIKNDRGHNFSYMIDDSGCYGVAYKGKCNYISTLYASWALSGINEDFPSQYLNQNKLDNRTIDHALGYILNNNNYDREWLLNNHLHKYWSYYSASISQEPDYFVSAIAAYALKNEFLFSEAKEYLQDKTSHDIKSSAIILHLLYPDQTKLPSISVYPGISNQKSYFNLMIKNNREPANIIIESPNFTGIPKNFYLQDQFNYQVKDIKENFEIIITYGNYSYTIPVIAPNQVLNEESGLLPPEKQAIKFLGNEVNLTLNPDDSLTDDLSFTNNWYFKLERIKLNATGRLGDILEFQEDYFDGIQSNETLNTKIYLNKDKNPRYRHYEGYLIVTSSQKTLDALKFSVNFLADLPVEDNQDTEDNEEIASNEAEYINATGKTKTSQVKSKSNLWLIILIAIFITGIIIFLFFRRKKEVTESFGEYAKRLR